MTDAGDMMALAQEAEDEAIKHVRLSFRNDGWRYSNSKDTPGHALKMFAIARELRELVRARAAIRGGENA